MSRSTLALVFAAVVVVLAIGTFATRSHPVDACFLQTQAQPAPGFYSDPSCQWYAPDGTPYSEMKRSGYPWYVVLTSMALTGGALVLAVSQAKNWGPAAKRALRYTTPGADLSPRA